MAMLLSFHPVALMFIHDVLVFGSVFLTEALLLSFFKVTLVDYLGVDVFISSESIELPILEHASVNVVLSFLNSVAIHISTVELPDVYLPIRCHEIVLAVPSHLSVHPLPLIPLTCGHDVKDSDPIFLAFAKLSLVCVTLAISDLANAFNFIILPKTFVNDTTLIN
jgi:hypothetical protein